MMILSNICAFLSESLNLVCKNMVLLQHTRDSKNKFALHLPVNKVSMLQFRNILYFSKILVG